jgi:hypothetical protein
MMNDMMPTIAETIDLNDIAQHEHEQWLRQSEREERWAALEAWHEAKHGRPLFTSTEWEQHTADMNRAIDERDAAFENAFKCDEDDDPDAWADDDWQGCSHFDGCEGY